MSQGRCVTGTLYGVSLGRSVTALKAPFIGLLLQYWLILKTQNFYFLSLYLAQFIDFIGGSPNPNSMTQRPYDTETL